MQGEGEGEGGEHTSIRFLNVQHPSDSAELIFAQNKVFHESFWMFNDFHFEILTNEYE